MKDLGGKLSKVSISDESESDVQRPLKRKPLGIAQMDNLE